MSKGFYIGSIFGFKLRADYSWLLIFAFLSYFLAEQVFMPVENLDLPRAVYWLMGFGTCLLFFATVIIHELAHSFAARAKKIPVKNISLFIFGGAAEMTKEPEKANDELTIAIWGPVSSAIVGVLFLLLCYQVFRNISLEIAYICQYVGTINLFLALFNLLPFFPLDGGRVLRSIIWGASKDYKKATERASVVGRIGGIAIIAGGLLWAFIGQQFFSGLWLAFIGWFLYTAATSSVSQMNMRQMLSKYTVQSALRQYQTIDSTLPLAEVAQNMIASGINAYLVSDQNGLLSSVLNADDLKKLASHQMQGKTVGQAAKEVRKELAVNPQNDLMTAVQMMNQHNVTVLPILNDDGLLLDVLHIEDLVRYLNMIQPSAPRG